MRRTTHMKISRVRSDLRLEIDEESSSKSASSDSFTSSDDNWSSQSIIYDWHGDDDICDISIEPPSSWPSESEITHDAYVIDIIPPSEIGEGEDNVHVQSIAPPLESETAHLVSYPSVPELEGTQHIDDARAGRYAMPFRRSLNQKSSAPSARLPYEQVYPDQGRELNGSEQAILGIVDPTSNSTPPTAPVRKDYMYRHATAPSFPYTESSFVLHQSEATNIKTNPAPDALADLLSNRTTVHEPPPSPQPPVRPTTPYRGNSAPASLYTHASGEAVPTTFSVQHASFAYPHSSTQLQQYEPPSSGKGKEPSPGASQSPPSPNPIQAQTGKRFTRFSRRRGEKGDGNGGDYHAACTRGVLESAGGPPDGVGACRILSAWTQLPEGSYGLPRKRFQRPSRTGCCGPA
ncbi:hypothetical protein DFH11DRAFT_1264905 [Phellopilus nigrolimitatus]|nr:hypothetical protein DFH11DRAFT_1264905 [Phellopilus nigrolimitatus]